MADRVLTLLALFASRSRSGADELAARLEVSVRTVQRDVETLRDLGYPVTSVRGPGGGYTFGPAGRLPPLLLDEEQAVAVAVALQTATPDLRAGPTTGAAGALAALRQVMPPRARAEADAVRITAAHDPWRFLAAPVDPQSLVAVGAAIRRHELLEVRRHGGDAEVGPPTTVEPYGVVAWAGRWYVVASGPDGDWSVLRLDRHRVRVRQGTVFVPRQRPYDDVATYVVERWDRDDVLPDWPCAGEVVMDLPASVAARWAPAGAVVAPVGPDRCRFTLGAWSWAAVLGLLATFDAPFEVVGPEALRRAAVDLADRCRAALSGS